MYFRTFAASWIAQIIAHVMQTNKSGVYELISTGTSNIDNNKMTFMLHLHLVFYKTPNCKYR